MGLIDAGFAAGAAPGLMHLGSQLMDYGMKKTLIDEERAAKAAEQTALREYAEGRYKIERKDRLDDAAKARTDKNADAIAAEDRAVTNTMAVNSLTEQLGKDRDAAKATAEKNNPKTQAEIGLIKCQTKHQDAQAKAVVEKTDFKNPSSVYSTGAKLVQLSIMANEIGDVDSAKAYAEQGMKMIDRADQMTKKGSDKGGNKFGDLWGESKIRSNKQAQAQPESFKANELQKRIPQPWSPVTQ